MLDSILDLISSIKISQVSGLLDPILQFLIEFGNPSKHSCHPRCQSVIALSLAIYTCVTVHTVQLISFDYSTQLKKEHTHRI